MAATKDYLSISPSCDDQRCSERKRRPNSTVERNKMNSKLGRDLHNKINQYPNRSPNDEITGNENPSRNRCEPLAARLSGSENQNHRSSTRQHHCDHHYGRPEAGHSKTAGRVPSSKILNPIAAFSPQHRRGARGREMIDLLAVEEPKPKPAKIRAMSY